MFFSRREDRRWAVKRKFLATKVIGTISPSKWLREISVDCESLKDRQHVTIPNPIDPDFWFPTARNQARKQLGIPSDVFSIGFGAAGGLRDSRKGGHALLDAVRILNNQLPKGSKKIRVDVFGQRTPKFGRGIKDAVFHGILSSEQLRDFYSAIDIFVTLPTIEGFPNTLVEAASCGTPTVATDIPGMRDVIESEKTGLLVSATDVDDLVSKLGFILENEEWLRKASRNARERAKALWSPRGVAIDYANFFQMIIASKR